MIAAIQVVAGGDALLAPSITRRLIEEFVRRPPSRIGPPSRLGGLTARELEVFRLLARGLSNAEIAAELVPGEATVKTHVGNLLTKLDLRDRVQAVVLAYESGLVQPGSARTTAAEAKAHPEQLPACVSSQQESDPLTPRPLLPQPLMRLGMCPCGIAGRPRCRRPAGPRPDCVGCG